MFCDSITYTDFDGNERTEKLYFNISEMEAMKIEIKYPQGYSQKLQDDMNSGDPVKIFEDFEEFVDLSYGRKTADGRKFEKSNEILADFKSTSAYDAFMNKLFMDHEYALKFALGIFPNKTGKSDEELTKEIKAEMNSNIITPQFEVVEETRTETTA